MIRATVTITMFKNGVQVHQVTDTSGSRIVSNGYMGFHLYGGSGSASDNFKVTRFVGY